MTDNTRNRRGWWRRLRRIARRRNANTTPPPKPWNAFVIIGLLLGFDQLSKHSLNSLFGWHAVPDIWLLEPAILAPFMLILIAFEPTRLIGVMGFSGAFGNFLSVIFFGAAPNPFLLSNGTHITAFNAADVYLSVALILTMYAVASRALQLAIHHRPRRQTA